MNKALRHLTRTALGSLSLIAATSLSSCSYLIYKIWDNGRTNSIIKSMEEAENNKGQGGEIEKFDTETYFEKSLENGKTVIKMLTLYSKDMYTLDYYEESTTVDKSFHMQGSYTRENNIVTVATSAGTYVTKEGDTYNTHDFMGQGQTDEKDAEIHKGYYESVWGTSYAIALNRDGTFAPGGTSDSNEAVKGSSAKTYRWDTNDGRAMFKALTLFTDNTYVITSYSMDSKNAKLPASFFFGTSTYEFKESLTTETYKVVEIAMGQQSVTMYGAGAGATVAPLGYNLYTMMVASATSFYVSDTGFLYDEGKPSEVEFPAWSFYVYTEPTDNPDQPGDIDEETIHLEVATSVEGKPFILDLNSDGTCSTGWTNYEQTIKEGSWYTFGNSVVILVDGYESSSTKLADGSVEITVNYGQMGDKTYTMSASQFEAAKKNSKPVRAEVETSVEGKPFIVEFNADGTVTAGWTNYEQTIKEGTWSFEGGALVIDVEGYAYTFLEYADGAVTFSIDFGQMGEKTFTIGGIEYAALEANAPKAFNGIHLEVATTIEGKPFILDLNKDGTCSTGWTNYEQTIKEGTWSVFGSSIIIEVEGYKSTVEYHANGIASITINYGQMGDKTYDLGADQYEALKLAASPLLLEVETNVEGKPFIVEFNADGTVKTGWTNYEQTIKEGTWSFVSDELVIDVEGYAYTFVSVVEGAATFTINYGQMGEKTYALSSEKYTALKNEAVVGDIHLEVATSMPDKPFILDLKQDGSVSTGWTNYPTTIKEGTWSIFGGKLVIAVDGYDASVVYNEDGTLDISINYGQMGEKVYKMSASDWNAIKGKESNIHHQVETSVEGKPFILEFNGDGSLTTGWTNYPTTIKTATWSAFGDKISLNLDGTGYTATISYKDDGSVDITINYGQMGEKTYTLTSAEHKALKANSTPIQYSVDTSIAGKPFILEFNADGTVTTGWTNYPTTIKDGTWSYGEGTLTITVEGYAATVTKEADGSATIVINYDQMGEKTYVISAADYALLTT
ncbi:MAG: hypothetical protein MJ241_04170 [Bacilli bacterium]|nr:hypothetical protein [Bacilli bacterium]